MDNRKQAWIVEWALEACVEKINTLEQEIVRHKGNLGSPIAATFKGANTDRALRIAECERALSEYHEMHNFLLGVKERLRDASAQLFAEQFVKSMKGRKA